MGEEATDDESYEEVHQIREKIESLLLSRLEVRRVKSHGRSSVYLSQCHSNLLHNLETLGTVLGEATQNEYQLEGVDLLPWAESRPELGLVVKF